MTAPRALLGSYLTHHEQRVHVHVTTMAGRQVLILDDAEGRTVTHAFADTFREAGPAGLVFYPSNSGDPRARIDLDTFTIGRILDTLASHDRRAARRNQEAAS